VFHSLPTAWTVSFLSHHFASPLTLALVYFSCSPFIYWRFYCDAGFPPSTPSGGITPPPPRPALSQHCWPPLHPGASLTPISLGSSSSPMRAVVSHAGCTLALAVPRPGASTTPSARLFLFPRACRCLPRWLRARVGRAKAYEGSRARGESVAYRGRGALVVKWCVVPYTMMAAASAAAAAAAAAVGGGVGGTTTTDVGGGAPAPRAAPSAVSARLSPRFRGGDIADPLVMGLQTRERQMPTIHAIMKATGTPTWRVVPPRSTTSPQTLRTTGFTRMWRGLGPRHLKMTSALHVSQPAAGAADRRRACREAALPAAPVVLPTAAAAPDAAAVVVDGDEARVARAVVDFVLGAAAVEYMYNGMAAPMKKPATVPRFVGSW